METTGKIIGYSANKSGGSVRLQLDFINAEEADRLVDCDLDIKITRHKEKRSRNANAYHWALCGKIAAVIHSTAQEVHKELMLAWGTFAERDGVAEYVIAQEDYEPSPEDYWKFSGQTLYINTSAGRTRHFIYWVVKPSHLYDTHEMAQLIDGTIERAKEVGVEVLPPHEIEKMKEAWDGQDGA